MAQEEEASRTVCSTQENEDQGKRGISANGGVSRGSEEEGSRGRGLNMTFSYWRVQKMEDKLDNSQGIDG